VKYINKDDVEHLASILRQNYEIDIDWEGTLYLGLTIDWDYTERKVHLSMPGYIEKALLRFGHEPPNKPPMQPFPHTIPLYDAKVQYDKDLDSSPPATKEEEKYIRQVVGVLLYYGRAVDSTVLVGLSSLAAAQSLPTAYTLYLVKWLLDYATTNPDAILTYKKSDMVLAIHSDASYLSEPSARSQVGGHVFCSSDVDDPPDNGAILNISKILSKRSCPVPPRPNSVLSTSTPVKRYPCDNSWKRWDTSNPPHLFKLTTALLSAWSPTTYNHVAPKRWI